MFFWQLGLFMTYLPFLPHLSPHTVFCVGEAEDDLRLPHLFLSPTEGAYRRLPRSRSGRGPGAADVLILVPITAS